jgi:hypothetical protein
MNGMQTNMHLYIASTSSYKLEGEASDFLIDKKSLLWLLGFYMDERE